MITPIDSTSTSGSGLNITGEGAGYLKETGGWAKFLAILGFVFIGLVILLAMFLGSIMGAMGMGTQMAGMEIVLAVVYIGMAALYFFPILYLFRFATKAQEAVKLNDTQTLTTALENLKSHYKFIGILAAVIMGFYAVAILITLVAGGAAMF
ncbi:MAG TPA: hypothetical protein VFE50_10325 [Cyclobacteriaceae bacterium]|nr:hypothetical protein [Cyclobacteriaceae bacterium]